MTRNKLSMTLTILVAIVMVVSSSQISTQCPRHCVCHDKFVSCKHKSLQSVPADIPWTTERLDLSFNSIASLPADSFANLSRLRLLRLDHNNMKSIDENAFRGNLNHLKDLYLTHNDLSRLHPDTFDKKLNELRHVYLSDNEFEQIPPLKATQMTRLNLDNNRIRSAHIDKSFTINIGLQTLVLTKNFIKRIDANDLEVLRECRLKSLMMKFNELEWIDPRAFEPVKHSLENLELEGNESLNSTIIERALAGFSGGQSMIYLELRRTNLTEISEGFFKPFNGNKLHRLDVSNNGALTKVNDNSFDGLNSVQYIHLERCGISSPGIRLSAMSGLRMANMSHNKLMRCPYRLPGSVETLELQWNDIRMIKREDFKSLSSLKVLNLCGNSILTIETDSFSDLSALESLDLSQNRLSVVQPKVFQPYLSRLTFLYLNRQNPCMKSVALSLPHVSNLDLSNNCLSKQLLIHQLPQLVNLSLRSNGFERLDRSLFTGGNRLERVDLSSNKITGWKGDVFSIISKSVIEINLSYNRISFVSSQSSSDENYLPNDFGQLRRILLVNNLWNCSICSAIDWILIFQERVVEPDHIICSSPPLHLSTRLIDTMSKICPVKIDRSIRRIMTAASFSKSIGGIRKSGRSWRGILAEVSSVLFVSFVVILVWRHRHRLKKIFKPKEITYERIVPNDDLYPNNHLGNERESPDITKDSRLEIPNDIWRNSNQNSEASDIEEEENNKEEPQGNFDVYFISLEKHECLENTGSFSVKQITDSKSINTKEIIKCEHLVIGYPWLDIKQLTELMKKRKDPSMNNYIFKSDDEDDIDPPFANIKKIETYTSQNLIKKLRALIP